MTPCTPVGAKNERKGLSQSGNIEPDYLLFRAYSEYEYEYEYHYLVFYYLNNKLFVATLLSNL